MKSMMLELIGAIAVFTVPVGMITVIDWMIDLVETGAQGL